MSRELAAEVGFDICDCIVLSPLRQGASVYEEGIGLTADYVLSLISTAQCTGRELAAEVGFDFCDRIVLSSSGQCGSVYRDGTGMTADYILSLISTAQCIVPLVSMAQVIGQEFAADTG